MLLSCVSSKSWGMEFGLEGRATACLDYFLFAIQISALLSNNLKTKFKSLMIASNKAHKHVAYDRLLPQIFHRFILIEGYYEIHNN